MRKAGSLGLAYLCNTSSQTLEHVVVCVDQARDQDTVRQTDCFIRRDAFGEIDGRANPFDNVTLHIDRSVFDVA